MVGHGALGRPEVIEVGVVDPVLAHVDLDLAVHPEPVPGEGEGRPRHHLEAQHVAVELLRLLEVVGPHEVVIQLCQRHGCLLVESDSICPEEEPMDPNAKKTALRMIPYGLYVLTAGKKGGPGGAGTGEWGAQGSVQAPLGPTGREAH